jgi:hypothetical protein
VLGLTKSYGAAEARTLLGGSAALFWLRSSRGAEARVVNSYRSIFIIQPR